MHEIGFGYWFVDTAGIGSIIVITVGLTVLVAYAMMLRWVQTAPREQPVVVTTAETAPADKDTGGTAE